MAHRRSLRSAIPLVTVIFAARVYWRHICQVLGCATLLPFGEPFPAVAISSSSLANALFVSELPGSALYASKSL
ncbi:hypothetical protein OF83DRAFT_1104118, partial [Amylostereum chailletii]